MRHGKSWFFTPAEDSGLAWGTLLLGHFTTQFSVGFLLAPQRKTLDEIYDWQSKMCLPVQLNLKLYLVDLGGGFLICLIFTPTLGKNQF